ncbi:MAG: regulatory protein RecX [Synergistales bacterium]|nr:regulatory protein RecX [Synergistales bacterium]
MDTEKYLITLISGRAYTRRELRKKLLARDDDEVRIEELLDLYEDYGYIDDLAYAKLYMDSHAHWGKRKIRDQLRIRGVSSGKIEMAFQEMEFDESDSALSLAKNWFDLGVSRERIYSRLLSRGFMNGTVKKAVSEACEENGRKVK